MVGEGQVADQWAVAGGDGGPGSENGDAMVDAWPGSHGRGFESLPVVLDLPQAGKVTTVG